MSSPPTAREAILARRAWLNSQWRAEYPLGEWVVTRVKTPQGVWWVLEYYDVRREPGWGTTPRIQLTHPDKPAGYSKYYYTPDKWVYLSHLNTISRRSFTTEASAQAYFHKKVETN